MEPRATRNLSLHRLNGTIFRGPICKFNITLLINRVSFIVKPQNGSSFHHSHPSRPFIRTLQISSTLPICKPMGWLFQTVLPHLLNNVFQSRITTAMYDGDSQEITQLCSAITHFFHSLYALIVDGTVL